MKTSTIIEKIHRNKEKKERSLSWCENLIFLILSVPTLYMFSDVVVPHSIVAYLSQCEIDVSILHDQSVSILSPEISTCNNKYGGIRSGKICKFDNQTYFLKLVECNYFTEKNSTQIVSYEKYNHQFVATNINARVPPIRFFKNPGSKTFYIGSKKVDGIKFLRYFDFEKKLSKTDYAKLLVSATFIRDILFDPSNWGTDKDGLILIDIDSAMGASGFYIPSTIKDYLIIAKTLFTDYPTLKFSLNVLREMKDVYIIMKSVPLPRFHTYFEQNQETYLELINIYISCCEKAIEKIEQLHPPINASEPSSKVYSTWGSEILAAYRSAKKQEVSQFKIK